MSDYIASVGLFILLFFSGCATYHPIPLPPLIENINDKNNLENYDTHAVAEKIKNPLIKSMYINQKNGISSDEVALLAVLSNPSLLALRHQRNIVAAQIVQAGILPNPQVTSALEIPIGNKTQGKFLGFNFGIEWEVSSMISRKAKKESATMHASSLELDIAWKEWQIAESARLHLYRLLIAHKRKETAKQAKLLFQNLKDEIKQGVNLGVKTQLDLSVAERGLLTAQIKELQAISTQKQEQIALNDILGCAPRHPIILETTSYPQLAHTPSSSQLFKYAEKNRLDLQAFRKGYQSQEYAVRAQVQSQFPKINIGFSGGMDTDHQPTLGIGLNIDLPFFDHNQGEVANKQATREQLLDEYHLRVLEARSNITRLVLLLASKQQQLDLMNNSVKTQKAVVQNILHVTENGYIPYFYYYEAIKVFYEKKFQSIDMEQQLIEAGVALEIASGHYGIVGKTKISMQHQMEDSLQ